MDVGSYVGNSTGAGNNDNRNVTGVGFEPEYVVVKRDGTVCGSPYRIHRPKHRLVALFLRPRPPAPT